MGCDFYIFYYLYVFFENERSYVPICINTEKRYFYDMGSERQLISNKPILIYNSNKFENTTYRKKYEQIIQQKINNIDKTWENISKIKIVEKRIEKF
jgi:hypothetical protein